MPASTDPGGLLARLLDNVPWLVPGNLPPFVSLPIPTVPGEWIAFIYFSYQVSSYRLWRGHIGHLIVGGRIRHVNNGSRITLRQAAIPALYDLAPLPFATLMVIPVLLLLVADGDRLDPLISWINGALELEHSFGTMLLILSLLVWMAHWPAVGCAG